MRRDCEVATCDIWRDAAEACSDLSLTVFSAMTGTGKDCQSENTTEKGLLKVFQYWTLLQVRMSRACEGHQEGDC
jgi:hypothetical protein